MKYLKSTSTYPDAENNLKGELYINFVNDTEFLLIDKAFGQNVRTLGRLFTIRRLFLEWSMRNEIE